MKHARLRGIAHNEKMFFENEEAWLTFVHLWIHDIDTYVLWSLKEKDEDLKSLYIRTYKRLILDFRRMLQEVAVQYSETYEYTELNEIK